MTRLAKTIFLMGLIGLLLPDVVLAIETITSGYQYRFSESEEWKQAPGLPFNFPDKTSDKVFINHAIPDGPTHMLIKQAFGKLTVRFNNRVLYQYGHLGDNGYLDPQDFPFHIVKIPDGKNRTIEFIVEGKSSAIGIDVLTIGSEKEIYEFIIDNDIYSVVFSFILMFVAVAVFILALRIGKTNRRLFLVFSVFAFSAGLWIISTTYIRQLLYANTVFWHYADYGLKSITAMSMAMFIDIVLGPGFLKLNRRIWQVQLAVILYYLYLCFRGVALFQFNNFFNILVFIYFLIWIPFFIYKTVKKNFEARFLLGGIVIFFVVAFLDSLFAAGIIRFRVPSTLGILAFVLCDGLILVVKIYKIFVSIESYSVELEKADKIKDAFLANTSHELQVVRNLTANAIKFSEPGQTIRMRIEKSDDNLLFSIADNGVGIPEDELELVFDKFTQSSKTKTNAGGTGLGLPICKEIILGHNGFIWAENNPDGGSIFKFQIPIQ